MSKILVAPKEFALHVSPTVVKELGTPAAVFLQKLYYLLNHAKRKNGEQIKHVIHQKRRWYWHSFENWKETLGLYSVSTIKRAIAKLSELGIIEIQKLNPIKRERINYYTINYKKLKQLFGISASVTKPQPQSKSKPEPEKIQGTEAPIHAEATAEELATIPKEHRTLYRQLRQYKLDISYNDPRLFFWERKARSVTSYTASATNRFNINKWQWHTPEQILPQELLRT